MTATKTAATLKEVQVHQHTHRDREDLADDECNLAVVVEWEHAAHPLAANGGPYDPKADTVVQGELAADAPVIDGPVIALPVSNAVQQLLDWAAAHPAASVRSRAARITADLSELTDRRDSEAAQREAEEKVAKAKAELEKAQEELRNVKAGTRTTMAATTAPTPIRIGLGSGRTREELAAIRTWARANGHQVADADMVRKAVLEAYDAAHQPPVRKAG